MEPMSWIAIASLVGSLLTSGFSMWKQQKENKTTRDFNAEEAEKNRQWQEEIYKKYESPTAQVLQRAQAGLNPYSDVTSQSVGTGSTASSGSSSLPGLSDPFSQFPSLMMQLKSFKIDQDQRVANLEKTKEETTSLNLDNQMKAIEAGNKQEWINLQMDMMREDKNYKYYSAEKLHAEAERAWDIANQSREFTNTGGNEFVDAHNKFVAELNSLNSRTDLTKEQQRGLKLANDLSAKFDEKFMQLDYQSRKQQVEEYLANADERKDLYQWSYELSNHQYLIQQLQDQYDRDIWMSVVNLLKEGNKDGNAFKKAAGILSGYFARNPAAALSSISQLINGLSPDINVTNKDYNTNVTYN